MKNSNKRATRQGDMPVLAVSTKWYGFPDHFEWAASQGFAFEYTPDPDHLAKLKEQTRPFLEKGILIRHHGFFPGFEFGDEDKDRSEEAVQLHCRTLDAIQGIGEPVITFHIGVTRNVRIDPGRARENLSRLVEYARSRGITINLENLKNGISSNPETIREWADASGSMITLDIGHAVSTDWRVQNGVSVNEIIDLFEDRLNEVHLYEQETDRHHPPKDLKILGSIIDRLLRTNCPWWTIELEDHEEILNTRRLVSDYIETKAVEKSN